ncbi:908_t:CDS:2, partial [Ambispora gerdemannii]
HIPAEGSTASEGVGFKPAEAQDSHSQTRRTESEISDMSLLDLVKQSGQVVQNKINLLSNAVGNHNVENVHENTHTNGNSFDVDKKDQEEDKIPTAHIPIRGSTALEGVGFNATGARPTNNNNSSKEPTKENITNDDSSQSKTQVSYIDQATNVIDNILDSVKTTIGSLVGNVEPVKQQDATITENVAYQPSSTGSAQFNDPLAVSNACERDIPYLKDLDVSHTTGRRSIFQVRGISYPPRRRAKSNKQNSQIENDENEIFEEVIRILESHIDGIEQKINVLTKSTIIQNSSEQISDKSNTKDSKFSELSTDELLKLTQDLGLLNNNYMEQNTTELIEQQNEEQKLKLQPRQFDFVFSWCNIPLNDFNIYSTSELGS